MLARGALIGQRMSSRFAELLQSENIDPRRLLVASRALERLRPEDRKIKLDQRLAKKKEGGSKDAGEKPERRSGRAVTPQLLAKAQAGDSLTGPQKTRLLRALNRVLEQKQREPVDLRKAF